MILFRLLPLWGKAAVLLAVVAAIGTAYGVWHHKVYNRGYDAALSAVQSANKEAIDARDTAVLPVKECFDSGREWDVTRGVCQGP